MKGRRRLDAKTFGDAIGELAVAINYHLQFSTEDSVSSRNTEYRIYVNDAVDYISLTIGDDNSKDFVFTKESRSSRYWEFYKGEQLFDDRIGLILLHAIETLTNQTLDKYNKAKINHDATIESAYLKIVEQRKLDALRKEPIKEYTRTSLDKVYI